MKYPSKRVHQTSAEQERIGSQGQLTPARDPLGPLLDPIPEEHHNLTEAEEESWARHIRDWPWLRVSDADLLARLVKAETRLARSEQAVREIQKGLVDGNLQTAMRVEMASSEAIIRLVTLLGGSPGRRLGETDEEPEVSEMAQLIAQYDA